MSEANCKPLPPTREADIHRFWTFVDQRGPDECWPWRGGLTSCGYGAFSLKGRTVTATRIAYRLQHGIDPYPLLIRHSCHTPACCNPIHLSTGTAMDNSDDMVRDGRSLTGDRNPSKYCKDKLPRGSDHRLAKFTEDAIFSIRSRYASGETATSIAKDFHVTIRSISLALKGITWAHVPIANSIATNLTPNGSSHYKSKLTEEQVRAIRQEYADGASNAFLCRKYNEAHSTIHCLIARKTWKHVT